MKNLRELLKSKLARRMVIAVLLFSSTITLFFTSLQLYLDYRDQITAIEREIDDITRTSLGALEENLWLLNLSSIELMLDGILQNKDIVYLEIDDENGNRMLTKGTMPEKNFRTYTIPLDYRLKGRSIPLGRFTIVATLENVYSRLMGTITYILVTQTIKTFVVSGFIVFIVWLLVSRHLTTIQRYTKKIRLDRPQRQLRLRRKEGKWTHDDELSNLVDAINMMRQEIYDSYSRIEHLSLHDPLTNLPNRRYLEEQLKRISQGGRWRRHYGAMLFLDLDDFKLLNDSLGHPIGDQILVVVAKRLESVIDERDMVARIGGDEFVVLLTNLSDQADTADTKAHDIAKRIQRYVSRDTIIEGKRYRISVSIGIALFRGEKCSFETLLKQADNALHESKSQGRRKITAFRPEMQKNADRRLHLEQRLHAAIRERQFVVHYQPKFDQSRIIRSAEALVRWEPSDEETIPPNLFIPIAEETGLIVEIGEQIVTMVCEMAAGNLDLIGASSLESIAINVSSRQFTDPGFSAFLIDAVRKHGLDPRFFILEITEEAMINDIDTTIQTMRELKQHGFMLSIDDFGTGYSSLRYLKDFPLDELKIDRSFVDHIVDNRNDRAIALSIIEMAKNLGLDVVAEGVENDAQFRLLADMECHIFQGFLFSRPLTRSAFLKRLRSIKGDEDAVS